MKNFTIGMYNPNIGAFPIKIKTIMVASLKDAEEYCNKRNEKLKRCKWKVDTIGTPI